MSILSTFFPLALSVSAHALAAPAPVQVSPLPPAPASAPAVTPAPAPVVPAPKVVAPKPAPAIAKPGDAPILQIKPRLFFQQALFITLLNPKAIVFYMAFFPLFVDPVRHQGMTTFAVMAVTIAFLTFLYCVVVIGIVHFAAERVRTSPRITVWLNRIAGTMLVAFGIKLAVGK